MDLDEQERMSKQFDCPGCKNHIDFTVENQSGDPHSWQFQSTSTSARPPAKSGLTPKEPSTSATDHAVKKSVTPTQQHAQLYPDKSNDELFQLYQRRSEEDLSRAEVQILVEEIRNRGFVVNGWGDIAKKPKLEETRDTSSQNITSPRGWQVNLTSNENRLRSNLESKLRIKRWSSILWMTVLMAIVVTLVLGFLSGIVWVIVKADDPFPIEWLVAVSIGSGFWISYKMNPFQTPEQFQQCELEAKRAAEQKEWQMAQIVCPHCHTRGTVRTWREEFRQDTLGRDIALMGVTRGMSLVFGTGSSEMGIKAYCSHCGTEWRMS